AIYEGTTGIHGMDLLGRKVMLQGGKGVKLLMMEVQGVIKQAAAIEALAPMAQKLGAYAKSLHEVTLHLTQIAMKNPPEVFLADATLYLEYFGIVTISWQWLKQAVVAQQAMAGAVGDDLTFYESKIQTCRYFFEYELPKTKGLHERLTSEERVTIETGADMLV
ncbi:MAG: acyl-CoA dehydrogenase C-terminal domain-containing protein, partial [Bacteroidota bacterium]